MKSSMAAFQDAAGLGRALLGLKEAPGSTYPLGSWEKRTSQYWIERAAGRLESVCYAIREGRLYSREEVMKAFTELGLAIAQDIEACRRELQLSVEGE